MVSPRAASMRETASCHVEETLPSEFHTSFSGSCSSFCAYANVEVFDVLYVTVV